MSRTSKNRQVGVEVTPEMVRAGIEVKRRYEWDEEDGDEERFLKNAFLAMYAVKQGDVSG